MPFKRKGLCQTDQIKCARLLAQDVNPKLIAKNLRTSVEVVKAHTQEALDKAAKAKKAREKAAIKHANATNATAGALARAAKEVLADVPAVPSDDGEFE